MQEFIPIATRFVDLPINFVMKRGGILHKARIAYEAFGQVNKQKNNVILILTGLSPDAHASRHAEDSTLGWWEAILGPDKPIDTNYWYVLCINSLGSCKGSTGPASLNPRTGTPYQLEFPALSIEDIADAAAYTVRALGFERLACVIGPSMGGMSALALIARHPSLTNNMINISGSVHSLPFSIAIRSLQREAICSDPNWNKGQYDELNYPYQGMIVARKLGMITYRSALELNNRFGRALLKSKCCENDSAMFGFEFEVESYLQCHAQRFIRCFDPNSYLYLSRCIDWFDLGECCGSTADEALSQLRLKKALVMGVQTDILFPIQQQKQIARGLEISGTEVQFLSLASPLGHDAFLIDTERFGLPVADFLSKLSLC